MSQPELNSRAAEWLLPPPGALWSWDEGGKAIIWADGSTLLFREELIQLVERFEGEGLPSAGLLMLVMGACKGKVPSVENVAARMASVTKNAGRQGSGDLSSVKDKAAQFYREALDRLKTLASVPPADLKGTPRKAHLVDRLSANSKRGDSRQVKEVLAVLRESIPLPAGLPPGQAPKKDTLLSDLFDLHGALEGTKVESVKLAIETGLEVLPQAAEIDLHPSEGIRAFLREIRDDPDFGGLARLTRDLMEGLTLPRALETQDIQAMGGLSDISNRGPLHRLLVSELAHDNDTLAVRVALNEALYLRNEPPAVRPRSSLCLVIDAGIRVWGLPRIFATAAAMALAAKSDKNMEVTLFRPENGGAAQVNLATRAGLISHLSALDTAEHPGRCLGQVFEKVNGDLPADLVVISHPRALNSEGFRADLKKVAARHVYLVGVDREGHAQIELDGPAGRKVLQKSFMDLGAILDAGEKRVLRKESNRLPHIFSREPLPFLMPLPDDVEEVVEIPTLGWVAAIRSGECFFWKSSRRGAVAMPGLTLKGETKAFFYDSQTKCVVLARYHSNDKQLTVYRWFQDKTLPCVFARAEVAKIEKVESGSLEIFSRNGLLYVVFGSNSLEVMDLLTGLSQARKNIPDGMRHLGQGYCTTAGVLYCLGWEGKNFVYYKVDSAGRPLDAIAVVAPRGGGEPWVVRTDGGLEQIGGGLKIPPNSSGVLKVESSLDGRRILLSSYKGNEYVVDLLRRTQLPAGRSSSRRLMDSSIALPRWSVRIRFTHAALDSIGQICLKAAKGYWVRIEFDTRKYIFLLGKLEGKPEEIETRISSLMEFRPLALKTEAGFTLQVAEWPGRGRAILDSRGMLHLQSSDVSLSELTFVLAESTSLPVWTNEGLMVGPAFFTGDDVSQNKALRIAQDYFKLAGGLL